MKPTPKKLKREQPEGVPQNKNIELIFPNGNPWPTITKIYVQNAGWRLSTKFPDGSQVCEVSLNGLVTYTGEPF